MSLYDKLPAEVCYICQVEGEDLVSPCGNASHGDVKCDIKTHRKCLQNISVCPKCSNSIISNKVKIFNSSNFMKNILIILAYILTSFTGMVLPGINIMGTFIDGRAIPNDIHGTFILALLISIIVGLGYGFGFLAYYDIILKSNENQNEDNMWLLCTMIKTACIVNALIFICHFFGFIILLIAYNTYYYNSYSFCVGLAFLISSTIAILIISGIFFYCRNLYHKNLEEETLLGV
jgi:hypothetical protein